MYRLSVPCVSGVFSMTWHAVSFNSCWISDWIWSWVTRDVSVQIFYQKQLDPVMLTHGHVYIRVSRMICRVHPKNFSCMVGGRYGQPIELLNLRQYTGCWGSSFTTQMAQAFRRSIFLTMTSVVNWSTWSGCMCCPTMEAPCTLASTESVFMV